MMSQGHEVFHFGFGQAPFPVVPGMVMALREYASENAYLQVAGIPELREALCDFHRRYDNLSGLHPDQVIVGPGSKELIFLLLSIFNGDVLLLSPSWTTYKPQCELTHHKPYIISTKMENGWKVQPEDIEQTIKENNLNGNKILVMCNPDNPTGICYTREQLEAISETCRKNNVIIISDEIYARLHYQQKHDTIARYYPEGTILSSGFSKWASAGGWRLGYHIYPSELKALKDAVKSAASHTYSCAAAPIQYAVAKALNNEEEIHSYILHTCRILATVAAYCHRELTSVGVKCIPSTAGYYIFPNFEILRQSLNKRGITTCEQMCAVMFEEANVALMAGGPAFLRPIDEFTTRLCYVNFDGKPGLEESQRLGLDHSLDENFLKTYCKPTYDGIQAIKSWVKAQLEK